MTQNYINLLSPHTHTLTVLKVQNSCHLLHLHSDVKHIFSGKQFYTSKSRTGPGLYGSVVRTSACELKGLRFNSSQGHIPRMQARSLVPVGPGL